MTEGPVFVEGWRPGLIGAVTAEHGRYYAREWGFGPFFEAKVAREFAGFLDRAGPDDLTLSAWTGERFCASLIVDAHDPEAHPGEAHLRWFVVADGVGRGQGRGQGLGGAMMVRAMAFLDQRGLSCVLTTFAGLDPARRLYERHGFTLVEESDAETWGVTVTEQRFERLAVRPPAET
jgi:ribosomal protein S18 acetylase RimI-like enzyme